MFDLTNLVDAKLALLEVLQNWKEKHKLTKSQVEYLLVTYLEWCTKCKVLTEGMKASEK